MNRQRRKKIIMQNISMKRVFGYLFIFTLTFIRSEICCFIFMVCVVNSTESWLFNSTILTLNEFT